MTDIIPHCRLRHYIHHYFIVCIPWRICSMADDIT